MSTLNTQELNVLIGLCDEFITETNSDISEFPRTGWAGTSFDSAVDFTGLSKPQVKGYLSQLVQKGFITLTQVTSNFGPEDYITLTPKCSEVIEYKGNYTWGAKNPVQDLNVALDQVVNAIDETVLPQIGSVFNLFINNEIVEAKVYKVNKNSVSIRYKNFKRRVKF